MPATQKCDSINPSQVFSFNMSKIQPKAFKGDGTPIHPGDGIVPILKEIGQKRLSIVGTGFYITRYGLFMTASHVLDELVNENDESIARGLIVHLAEDNKVHFRNIFCYHRYKKADLAIGHADNYKEQYPTNPLQNLRGTLSGNLPKVGTKVITYAYPENKPLDFTNMAEAGTIRGDYFQGQLLRYVSKPENPSMPCGYFETSIEIRSGASGGPVFDDKGKIIGVNCRGWDFRGGEEEGNHLSYVIPIIEALPIEISHLRLPENSWEQKQIPSEVQGKPISFLQLVKYGHIKFNPPLS